MYSTTRLLALLQLPFLAVGCGSVHLLEDAGFDDGGVGADSGRVEPCPDFSCEPRCSAVSVCNCLAPDGDAECARRGGRCDADSCVLPDAGRPDGGVGADAGHDAGGRDAGGPTPGIPCGAGTCEAAVSFCLACGHYDPPSPPDAHCEPLAAEGWVFGEAQRDHPCGFPGAFVECDGPEDCGPGRPVCTYSGGEWGYGQCWGRDEAFGAVACHTDADCADGSRCGEVDPLGYFSPLFDVLGWRPHACGGASPEASAFCDRYETACGIGEASAFYAREPCLAYLDGLSEDEQDCALTHLAEAEAGDVSHCEHASDTAPCAR